MRYRFEVKAIYDDPADGGMVVRMKVLAGPLRDTETDVVMPRPPGVQRSPLYTRLGTLALADGGHRWIEVDGEWQARDVEPVVVETAVDPDLWTLDHLARALNQLEDAL